MKKEIAQDKEKREKEELERQKKEKREKGRISWKKVRTERIRELKSLTEAQLSMNEEKF